MVDYISARCTADGGGISADDWPRKFLVVPRVSDVIQSKKGELREVLRITHAQDGKGIPHILVNLGKALSKEGGA